jgi:hypothetical protein
VSDYGELVDYRDMVTTIKDIIEDMIKKGMTLEQVKAANPTAGYRKAVWVRHRPMDDGHVRRSDLQRVERRAKPVGKTE